MKCAYRLLLLTILFLLGNLFNFAHTTCVLESDFGITLNCAFKKSGLFRIRNLGGLKASIGLGLSLGDELGFKESISNTEINRRRSTQVSKMQAQLIQASQKKKDEDEADKLSNNDGKVSVSRAMTSLTETSSNTKVFPKIIGEDRRFSTTAKEIPPFKPIPPAPERPIPNKPSGFRPVDPSKVKVMAVFAVPKHQENHDNNNNILDRNGQNMDEVESLRFPDFPHNFTQNSKDFANILQQQQILNLIKVSTPSTTVTTTNRRPVVTKIIKPSGSIGKVMNAPKEYYPVGYDKNFDDNFAARVELPETSFHCGNQKHFPGLYADEDLGCMVFHVCALTEDGLIMKSFLCPESTLYDQTILKCNWWFYVDCKNSKNLYDSNIPISKSYQLMKALTFFSAYKKETPELKKLIKVVVM